MEAIIIAPDKRAIIKPANWRDLNQLRQLETSCFPKDAWPLLDLVGVLTLPNVIRLRAMLRNLMIGFVAADIRPTEQVAWIATIAILPNYRGYGLGSTLLYQCEEKIFVPTIRLSVRITNFPAIRMYQKAGYQDIDLWKEYYHDGEDALIMEKRLR
jgi:[ribosomal protein S18]-alanine N-acetyltransferase